MVFIYMCATFLSPTGGQRGSIGCRTPFGWWMSAWGEYLITCLGKRALKWRNKVLNLHPWMRVFVDVSLFDHDDMVQRQIHKEIGAHEGYGHTSLLHAYPLQGPLLHHSLEAPLLNHAFQGRFLSKTMRAMKREVWLLNEVDILHTWWAIGRS